MLDHWHQEMPELELPVVLLSKLAKVVEEDPQEEVAVVDQEMAELVKEKEGIEI